MLYPLVLIWIVLHTLDGHEVTINVDQITRLHATREGRPNKFYAEGVNCIVSMTDGKLVSVVETCEIVKQRMETAR